MQRTVTVLVSLTTAVAVLLLTIAALLIFAPELLVTDLRVAATIACGIAGLSILIPVIIILHFSIEAKRKSKESINR